MEPVKKILLVDDESAIVRILTIKLRVSGYEVLTASNGEEALGLVDAQHPDLMLLDIVMPGMGGLEVLRRLRPRSRLPVIALSARLETAQSALRSGADDFVAKPFDMDELLAKIGDTLAQPRG
jgi:DNA-binding response OmpR family regulator